MILFYIYAFPGVLIFFFVNMYWDVLYINSMWAQD